MTKQLSLSNLSEAEKNERAAAAVTNYGVGTRSYNRSPEKREMDRQRAEATEKYARGELKLTNESHKFLLCHCRSFPHSHPKSGHNPELHKQLKGDWDWRTAEERRSTYFGWES